MKDLLSAEFKKLTTLRSTYILTGLVFLLVGGIAFYAEGVRGYASADQPNKLADLILNSSMAIGFAAAILGTLQLGNEYRYNTITYTLVGINRRYKVLAAKIVVVAITAVSLALAGAVLVLIVNPLGITIGGHHLANQQLPLVSLLAKTSFFTAAYALAGLLIIALFRSLVWSFVTLFFLGGTVEGLLSLLLKDKADYLPFSSLVRVLSIARPDQAPIAAHLKPLESALIFCVYLLVGWAVAFWLFEKRDAS